ncbi:hypothetical protein [Pedobacter boryungensis]|uniref:Lipoprotein n=1 Tax=Pedobacter boryungensis TaxID=869962 RepID=A0ABX2DCL6_9SPHI|nr:hypothetical protein [Pedobacter boryungensis]NQX31552.1 hypothetical protein [Pedobacter boryungensis]
MKKYWKFFIIFCFAVEFGCTNHIEKYDLSPFIEGRIQQAKNSSEPVKLELCNQTIFKWDKIIVLKPYSSDRDIDKYNLINGNSVKSMLPTLTSADWMCVLLFIENNMVVKYSNVNFALVDFTKIESLDKMNFTISKKIACEQLYIRNINNGLSLSF